MHYRYINQNKSQFFFIVKNIVYICRYIFEIVDDKLLFYYWRKFLVKKN